jgi:ribosomal protein L29|tara:strand:- start:22 stop:516 length:495 start_codon:yes stop_codon:yes gene_type:complete
MGKKPIVKLRVYRGSSLSFNQDGTIQNENQLISVEHGSIMWKLTMKNLSINGYCKVSAEKVFVDVDGDWKEDTINVKKYEDEIKAALNPKPLVAKTADQIRIENLEAKIEALLEAKEPKEVVIEEDNSNLKELQLEYFTLKGKKAHHMMKEGKLIEEIDKLKNK